MAYTFDTGVPYGSLSDIQFSQQPEVKVEPTANMFGLLDMLATVATQTLNADESLKNVVTRPFSLKTDVKQEFPATKMGKNPRRLTDYNVFGFQQISKMSLNSLVRLFTETEFDEMKKVFRYRCALMPENVCRETIQSFGNEAKAKQAMKTHLQGHIRNLLRHNDYLNFTAEPVAAKHRRVGLETTDAQTSLNVRVDSAQMSVEKENSVVSANSRATTKKFKMEASESKHFLAEISNDPTCPQAKRHKTDVSFYDTSSDVVVRAKYGEEVSPALIRHFKSELEEEARSSPEEEAELIPYYAPVARVAENVKAEMMQPPNSSTVDEDHSYFRSDSENFEFGCLDVVDSDDEVEAEVDEMCRLQKIVDLNRNLVDEKLVDDCDRHDLSIGAEVELRTFSKILELSKQEKYTKKKSNQNLNVPVSDNSRSEADEVSEAVKAQALAAIQDLKSKGAATDELTCTICDPAKSFTAYTTLLSHLRSHAQIRPYECNKCHAVFTRQHSLNYHLLIHANSTRFTCTDCGRKFRHPSHFKEHRRRHTGESPFSCGHCDQKYKTRNTFKRHLKAQHGKILSESSPESVKPKSGRTVRPKVFKVEKNKASAAVVPVSVVKKYSEDDFIVDYHYGDSVSNDDEVAKLSEKRRKMSVDVELTTSSTTSSSYYPSTNSEFSTPEASDDLPKFVAKPPPGVSGVSMTVKKVSEQLPAVPSPTVKLTHASGGKRLLAKLDAPARIKIETKGRADGSHSDRIVTTKPAFLAQINGEQVLLIHGATPNVLVKEKVNSFKPPTSACLSAQSGRSFAPPLQGQSKLEQCLRYGSAAVSQKPFPAKTQSHVSSVAKNKPPFVVQVPRIQAPQVLAPKRNAKPEFTLPPTPKFFVINSDNTLEPQVVLDHQGIPLPMQEQFSFNPHQLVLPFRKPSAMFGQPILTSQPTIPTPIIPQGQGPDSTLPVGGQSGIEFFVPEMVGEEEVVSCEDSAAEVSVRIESSSPSQQQEGTESQFYNPKWSPVSVKQNRDKILCDLLGIEKK